MSNSDRTNRRILRPKMYMPSEAQTFKENSMVMLKQLDEPGVKYLTTLFVYSTRHYSTHISRGFNQNRPCHGTVMVLLDFFWKHLLHSITPYFVGHWILNSETRSRILVQWYMEFSENIWYRWNCVTSSLQRFYQCETTTLLLIVQGNGAFIPTTYYPKLLSEAHLCPLHIPQISLD